MNKTRYLFPVTFFLFFFSCENKKKFTKEELKSLDPNGVYLSIEDVQKLKFNMLNSDSILQSKKNSLNEGCFYILKFDSLSKKLTKQCLVNPKHQMERQKRYLNSDSIAVNQDIKFIISGDVPKYVKVYSSEDNYKTNFDTLNKSTNYLVFSRKCSTKGIFKLIIKTKEKYQVLKYNYSVH